MVGGNVREGRKGEMSSKGKKMFRELRNDKFELKRSIKLKRLFKNKHFFQIFNI